MRPRYATTFVTLSLLACFAVAVMYARALYAPCDDAYIYLVYVKNLLAGNGLTYNGLHVQGFTSVLWVALLSLAGLLPFELPAIAEHSSMAAGLFVMVAAYLLGRRVGLSRPVSLAVPLVLAFHGDFAFYMSNGLETLLFTGMLLLSARYLITEDPEATLRSWSVPVVLSLTMLARPEGALMAALVVGFLAWRSRAFATRRLCVLRMILLLAPFYLFIRVYYGSFLPNTYYAKTVHGFGNLAQGACYLWNFFLMEMAVIVSLIAVMITWGRRIPGPARALLLFLAVWIVHFTVQGGDNMVGFRGFLPVVPMLYLLVVWGMHTRRAGVVLLVTVLLAGFSYYSYNYRDLTGSSWNQPIAKHRERWANSFIPRRDVGQRLKAEFPPGTTVAVSASGMIPYYSEQPTLDMLGLNDKHIARKGERDRSLPYGHQAGDANYILDSKPDVIVVSGAGRHFVSERGLWKQARFLANYKKHPLPYGVTGFIRRDFSFEPDSL